MNPLRWQYARLFELLALLAERRLSGADAIELRELLIADPLARGIYRQYQTVIAGLSWECTDPAGHAGLNVSEASNAEAGTTQRIDEAATTKTPFGGITRPIIQPILGLYRGTASTLSRPVFWSICTVGAMFCLYAGTLLWNLRSGDLPSGTDGNALAVATIRNSDEVEWSSLTPASTRGEGSAIAKNSPLSIQSGLIELQLKQGTTLLIEGPADWKIDGENSATLTHGKLVAKVPQQAVGFTLETPTARIVDLGTEFGVEVQDSGDTVIEVLRGVVDSMRLADGDLTPSGPARIRLGAGEAIQYEAGRAPAKRIAADETRFSRLYGKAVEADDAYAKTVLADRPLAYWRLSDGHKEQARDASGNNYHGSYSGALIPNQPGPLSTSADRSIRLQGAAAEGWMTVKHLPLGPSFTIELWAKSATPHWNAHGWLGSARTPNGLIVHPFANKRAWQGYVFDGRDGTQLHEIGQHEPARIDDRFHHYAVSYDDATDTGRMYFDGKQVAEHAALLKTNKRLASTEITLLLGYDPGATGPKLGDGWIDEVAVFDRVLSETEIRAHYDAIQAVAAETDRDR